jgi:hypothetical protein
MAGNNIAVFGIYPSALDAERGAADLISAGYASHEISVLLADVRRKPEFSGALLAGALGILTGSGVLAIPGIGPMLAAGPILTGLTDLGVGGAVGSLPGALVRLGIPEYEAKRYVGRIEEGGTLLSVRCDGNARLKRAKQILNSSGADDVASCQESRSDRVELAVI